jgi:hypothetical protein
VAGGWGETLRRWAARGAAARRRAGGRAARVGGHVPASGAQKGGTPRVLCGCTVVTREQIAPEAILTCSSGASGVTAQRSRQARDPREERRSLHAGEGQLAGFNPASKQ